MSSTIDDLNTASEAPSSPGGAGAPLKYTRGGLVCLYLYLIWAFICYSLIHTIIPSLLPLTLNKHQVSNAATGTLLGSMLGITYMLVSPVISYRSDRYRSRLGRRIPYLLWTGPFMAIFTILVGYGDVIALWLHSHGPGQRGISAAVIMVAVMVVFMLGVHFFNAIFNILFYALAADVVPTQWVGRFFNSFQVAGALSAFVYSRYMFGHAETHGRLMYVVFSLMYFTSILLVGWRVQEPPYPPPPPPKTGRTIERVIKAVRTYVRECYSRPFFLLLFIGGALWNLNGLTGFVLVFFARDELGMTLDQMGKVGAWATLMQLALYIPMGYLADKVHPFRMHLVGLFLCFLAAVMCFFFIQSATSYLVCTLISVFVQTAFIATNGPLTVALVPKARFAQFGSAAGIFTGVIIAAGSPIGGMVMDWVDDYRYSYLWSAAAWLASLITLLIAYQKFRHFGGVKYYRPPEFEGPAG